MIDDSVDQDRLPPDYPQLVASLAKWQAKVAETRAFIREYDARERAQKPKTPSLEDRIRYMRYIDSLMSGKSTGETGRRGRRISPALEDVSMTDPEDNQVHPPSATHEPTTDQPPKTHGRTSPKSITMGPWITVSPPAELLEHDPTLPDPRSISELRVIAILKPPDEQSPPPADADPVRPGDRLGESEFTGDLHNGLEWLNSLRSIVKIIHALIFGLDDEAHDGTDTLRTMEACNWLYELRMLLTNAPEFVFMGPPDIALRKVAKLVEHAPWPREGTARPDPPTFGFERNERLPMTKAIMKYVESIKARSLEDILGLLADVPPQVPPRPTVAPTSDVTGGSAIGEPTTPPASPAGTGPDGIDYDKLATALAKQRKAIPAALVRYMRDKVSALLEDVAQAVHGDPDTSEKAMSKNANRTSEALAELQSRLWFRVAGGMMHKEINRE